MGACRARRHQACVDCGEPVRRQQACTVCENFIRARRSNAMIRHSIRPLGGFSAGVFMPRACSPRNAGSRNA